MNRRIVLISGACVVLLLSVTSLALLTYTDKGRKVTVSSVNAEASNGQFPSYIKSERLDFAVRNAGSKPVSVGVSEIRDEHGNWVPSLHPSVHLEPGKSAQYYLYVPLDSHPRGLRLGVYQKASPIGKAQVALRLLIDKASGRYSGKQVWFDRLEVRAYEFIVNLDKKAQLDGGPTGNQPIRSEINETSSAVRSHDLKE